MTAKRQNKSVGVFFWVGSDVDFGPELNPDKGAPKYDTKITLDTRIDQVIKWLTVEKKDLGISLFD